MEKEKQITLQFIDAFTEEFFFNYYESKQIARIAAYEFCKYIKTKEKGWYGKSDDLKYWESIIIEIDKL